MARINLLPWRAEQRKQRQRDFLLTLGTSAAAMVVLVVYAHFHFSAAIDTQNARNAFMEKQIKEVDARIKEINELEKRKEQLIARMKVIEGLQKGRSEIVHVFDELVKATPDGLYFTSLVQRGNVMTIEGMAQSNARVSALMRSLDASPYFGNPTLNIIEAIDKSDRRKFRMTVAQTPPVDPAEAAAADKTGAAQAGKVGKPDATKKQ